MSKKYRFEKHNKLRHGTEPSFRQAASPKRDSEEWEAGEQTQLFGTDTDERHIDEIRKLLAFIRTTVYFMQSPQYRLPFVQRVRVLHRTLLISKTLEGYIGGYIFRQAKRLLDSHGL